MFAFFKRVFFFLLRIFFLHSSFFLENRSVELALMKPKVDWKSLASRHWKGSINDRRFSALFGLSVPVVEEIWSKVSFAFRTESLKPVHLLWLLYWFKCYDSDDASSAVWGVAPDTWRKHRNHALWVCFENMDEVHRKKTFFIVTVDSLKYFIVLTISQIHWSDRLKDFVPTKGLFPLHTFSVDVTECQLESPCDTDLRQFTWSGKQQMASLKYERTFGF